MSADVEAAEELLKLSAMGARKLNKRERKAIVLSLLRSGRLDDHKEHQLAKDLGCSLGKLREMRQDAIDVLASAISADEAMTIMAMFVRDYDLLIAEALAGLRDPSVERGTGAHQSYLRIVGELWEGKVSKLQSIGVIPKELGRLTSVKEEWEATVSVDGVVGVQRTEDTPSAAGEA